MTSPVVGFPLETVYFISNISKTMPGVVSLTAVEEAATISVDNLQTITISKVKGMPQINNLRFITSAFDPVGMTFSLLDLFGNPFDTSHFSAYISGGQINIISFPGYPPGLMFNNI